MPGGNTGDVLKYSNFGTAYWDTPNTGTTSPWLTESNGISYNSGATANVGIGKASFSGIRLDVDGKIRTNAEYTFDAANDGIISFGSSIVGRKLMILSNYREGLKSNINGISITSIGNVGIGIDDPDTKLEVAGKTKTESLQITSGVCNTNYVLTASDANGNTIWKDINDFMEESIWSENGSGNVYFEDGYVGIGTNNPSASLEVIGTTKTSGFQMTNGAVDGYVLQSNASGIASWVPLDIPAFESHWTVSGGNIYRESGKVGIGIEPNLKELDVNGNVSVNNLICGSTRATNSNYLTLQGSELNESPKIFIGKQESGENHIKLVAGDNEGVIQFFPGGTPKITMRPNEFVVGFPDADGSRLMDFRVNGKIWTNEVEVLASGWWDRVFSEDYELRSIEEVELFINENSHLPDIPSEEDVMQNGINLGEMDGLLLKKIEELTLYIIQQQKEIEDLKILVKSSK